MLNFNEELLQFIWRYRLLKPGPLVSTTGKEITVIKVGELNVDSGPDFFNSQIRVQDVTLVGNVEIHLYTSDWLKHNHHFDEAYNNIILHVVYEHDIELQQNILNNVEVLELKNLITVETLDLYQNLSATKNKLPCSIQLPSVDDGKFLSWMKRMTLERLQAKQNNIENIFISSDKDYTHTFYTLLLRSFGFKVNALPFELLAKSLPVSLLLRHSDNLVHLEALLLGMAGRLDSHIEDKYLRKLQNEFEYLKAKYHLVPLDSKLFKFSKLRPANFPDLRLAQFATLISNNVKIFTSPETCFTYKEIKAALTIQLTGYWRNHYSIDGNMVEDQLSLGSESIENLIINAFAPFFYFYGHKLNKPVYTEAAFQLLDQCKSEGNFKTRLFAGKKKILSNAALSQGIINLYDNYCQHKKCLKCGVAASLLNVETAQAC